MFIMSTVKIPPLGNCAYDSQSINSRNCLTLNQVLFLTAAPCIANYLWWVNSVSWCPVYIYILPEIDTIFNLKVSRLSYVLTCMMLLLRTDGQTDRRRQRQYPFGHEINQLAHHLYSPITSRSLVILPFNTAVNSLPIHINNVIPI